LDYFTRQKGGQAIEEGKVLWCSQANTINGVVLCQLCGRGNFGHEENLDEFAEVLASHIHVIVDYCGWQVGEQFSVGATEQAPHEVNAQVAEAGQGVHSISEGLQVVVEGALSEDVDRLGSNFEVSLSHVNVVSNCGSISFALFCQAGIVLVRVRDLRDHVVVDSHVGVKVGDAVRVRVACVSLQVHEGGLPEFGVRKEGTRVLEQIENSGHRVCCWGALGQEKGAK